MDDPLGVFVDDATNRPTNPDATPTESTILRGGLGADVFAATGEAAPALTSTPNLVQQAYLLSTGDAGRSFPSSRIPAKPFVLLFWSRDPDATQHGAIGQRGSPDPRHQRNQRQAGHRQRRQRSEGSARRAGAIWPARQHRRVRHRRSRLLDDPAKRIPTDGRRQPAASCRRAFLRSTSPTGSAARRSSIPTARTARSIATAATVPRGQRADRPDAGCAASQSSRRTAAPISSTRRAPIGRRPRSRSSPSC